MKNGLVAMVMLLVLASFANAVINPNNYLYHFDYNLSSTGSVDYYQQWIRLNSTTFNFTACANLSELAPVWINTSGNGAALDTNLSLWKHSNTTAFADIFVMAYNINGANSSTIRLYCNYTGPGSAPNYNDSWSVFSRNTYVYDNFNTDNFTLWNTTSSNPTGGRTTSGPVTSANSTFNSPLRLIFYGTLDTLTPNRPVWGWDNGGPFPIEGGIYGDPIASSFGATMGASVETVDTSSVASGRPQLITMQCMSSSSSYIKINLTNYVVGGSCSAGSDYITLGFGGGPTVYETATAKAFYPEPIVYTNGSAISNTPTGNVTVSLSPTPAYYNTLIQGFANVGALPVNVSYYLWTLYVNGSNYTSGNQSNDTNPSGGFYPNVNASLFNLTHFTNGSMLILSAQATLANGTVINYSNSTQLTISNSLPIITNLYLVQNGSVSSGVTLQGNITVQDNDTITDTLRVNYSWFKNGLNRTEFAGSFIVSNGTWALFNLSPAGGFNVSDNWSAQAQASDGSAFTITYNTSNATIQINAFNVTMNSTTQEYDLFTYSHGLNFTAVPGTILTSVTASYGGSTWLATLTAQSGNIYQYNASIQPPFTSSNSSYFITWNISGLDIGGNAFSQINTTPYQILVNASGIYNCNATINTPSVNYSFYDENTLGPINATFTGTYSILSANGSVKTTSATFTNVTGTVCIGPASANLNAQAVNALVNAAGYEGKILSELNSTYNSTVQVRSIPMTNSTLATPVTITVQNPQAVPFANYTVQLLRFQQSTNTYNLSQSGITNAQGIIVLQVQSSPASYAVLTYDNNMNLVQNLTYPPTVFCASVPLGSTCSYNIIIGGTYTDYYQTVTSTLDVSSFCSFNSTSLVLNCTYPGDPASTIFFIQSINLTLSNGSWGNLSQISSNATPYSTTTRSVSISLPNVSGYYNYVFSGLYVGMVNDSTLTGSRLFQTGTITINVSTVQPYGRDGWFIAALLALTVGITVGVAAGPLGLVWGSAGTFLILAIAGFIYLSPVTIAAVAIGAFIIGIWVK